MAVHNMITIPGFTENLYRTFKAGEDAERRYKRVNLAKGVCSQATNYTSLTSVGTTPPHAFINGIIVPENRELLDPETSVCSPIGRVIPEAGNMPYRNMNKTVNTGTLLDVWKADPNYSNYVIYYPSFSVKGLYLDDVLSRYPKGKRLTVQEIKEIEANYLGEQSYGIYDGVQKFHYYSGYLMLLQDALYQFKMLAERIEGRKFCEKFIENGKVYENYLTFSKVSNISYDFSLVNRPCVNQLLSELKSIMFRANVDYVSYENGKLMQDHTIHSNLCINPLDAVDWQLTYIAVLFGYDALAYVFDRLHE